MLLSIITVTFRDLHGLRRTINSLARLRACSENDVELIIIDGGTGSDFQQIASSLSGNVRIVSEPDDGIYDAMNKGLRMSRGDFVWFLNGGDECTIEKIQLFLSSLRRARGTMAFAGYSLDTGFGRISRKPRTSDYIWHGLPTSHQAIFYPGDIVRAQEYDLSYKIVGDYELTARLLKMGVESSAIDHEVASFQLGGVSQRQARLVALEASRVQKTTLGYRWHYRAVSRLRHIASRNLRRLQTREWARLTRPSRDASYPPASLDNE
ncbi:glycosyltransferase [Paenarthrobacter sp. NEAU-H11]|uniref:glycosyltransferase n=1 Tax=Paenarthrobacter sp. NEAU-H11 TaxID=3423924 RepID=UPI003D35462C